MLRMLGDQSGRRGQRCTWMLNSATEPVLPVPMQPPIRTISILSRASGNRVTSREALVSAPVQTSVTRSCLHEGPQAVKNKSSPAACRHQGEKGACLCLSCCTDCRSCVLRLTQRGWICSCACTGPPSQGLGCPQHNPAQTQLPSGGRCGHTGSFDTRDHILPVSSA